MKNKLSFILVISCLIIIAINIPVMAKEKVTVTGGSFRYYKESEQLIITQGAQVVAEEVTIRAKKIYAIFRDGEILEIEAVGNVEMEKDDDIYYSEKLNYDIKDKTGLILEVLSIRETEDKNDKKHQIYIRGDKAEYTEEMIKVHPGSITSCDAEEPHYFFKARRMEIIPKEEIKLYHVVFWEFNGKVPLFYWPYYSISLKEDEKRYTYKVGYGNKTGWFLKTTFFDETKEGLDSEYYIDYYQKLDLAGGFKQDYVQNEKSEGSAYVYVRKQDEEQTLPAVEFEHSHIYKDDNWNLKTNTEYYDYQWKDSLKSTNNLGYTRENSSISLNSSYSTTTKDSGYQTEYLKNTLRTNTNIRDINIDGQLRDNRYLHSPDNDYWDGHFKVKENKGFLKWAFTTEKERESYEYNLYTLPEGSITLDFANLKTRFRPYVAPFDYTMKAGLFLEEKTQTAAYRWVNEGDFTKSYNIMGPFRLNLKGDGEFRIYSDGEYLLDYLYRYKPSIGLQTNPFYGFSTKVDYAYENGEGGTPFSFDRTSAHLSRTVNGSLNYRNKGLSITSSTGYNLTEEKFKNMRNKLSYRWNKRKNYFTLSLPYDIENQQFLDSSTRSTIRYTDLTFDLTSKFNIEEREVKYLKSKLDWEVEDQWHITLEAAMDPRVGYDLEERQTKGNLSIVKYLHCREIKLTYDAVQKETWFKYTINAFPETRFRIGSDPEEPVKFDMGLGGVNIGK